MKKNLHKLLPVLFIMVVVSCNGNPFMFNLFSSIDPYVPGDLNTIQDILSEPEDELLDALSDDPDLAEKVIDELEEVLLKDPASASTDDQEAALLLANVELAVSGVDKTLNNVNSLLEDPASIDFGSPEDIFTNLFDLDSSLTPAQQEALVVDQIAALFKASAALEFYGETLVAGLDPSVETAAGDTAYKALTAGMINYMVTNAQDGGGNPMNPAVAIAAIAAAIVDPVNNDFPALAPNPDVDDAANESDMLEAMLGSGLTAVVNEGFDLNKLEGMM